ncbi:hypothetical protein P154DRAFT_41446 [Amniculicola lignicola CBS 123094]|uniref:Uncharacterized protein n=1 Tax=Amniculicola lignicola CBS 123094 TaxID=1392246 RepID=A0A6A5W8S5_9PLEO|nr:hypothetical protein P154DRAFT_41446 [Amniculicola lignicola CBS 123094]
MMDGAVGLGKEWHDRVTMYAARLTQLQIEEAMWGVNYVLGLEGSLVVAMYLIDWSRSCTTLLERCTPDLYGCKFKCGVRFLSRPPGGASSLALGGGGGGDGIFENIQGQYAPERKPEKPKVAMPNSPKVVPETGRMTTIERNLPSVNIYKPFQACTCKEPVVRDLVNVGPRDGPAASIFRHQHCMRPELIHERHSRRQSMLLNEQYTLSASVIRDSAKRSRAVSPESMLESNPCSNRTKGWLQGPKIERCLSEDAQEISSKCVSQKWKVRLSRCIHHMTCLAGSSPRSQVTLSCITATSCLSEVWSILLDLRYPLSKLNRSTAASLRSGLKTGAKMPIRAGCVGQHEHVVRCLTSVFISFPLPSAISQNLKVNLPSVRLGT